VKLAWAVLCKSASVDSTTNNISLFEVLEEVEVAVLAGQEFTLGAPNELAAGFDRRGGPAVVAIPMELVTLWRREEIDGPSSTFRIRILGRDRSEVGLTGDVEVQWGENARYRNRARFAGMPLPAPGENIEYQFVVEVPKPRGRWTEVASVPLLVKRRLDSPDENSPKPKTPRSRIRGPQAPRGANPT
jgi:hypothetical protein